MYLIYCQCLLSKLHWLSWVQMDSIHVRLHYPRVIVVSKETAPAGKRRKREPSPTPEKSPRDSVAPPPSEADSCVLLYVPYNDQVLSVIGSAIDPSIAAVLPPNPSKDYEIKMHPANEKYYISSMSLGMSRWVPCIQKFWGGLVCMNAVPQN